MIRIVQFRHEPAEEAFGRIAVGAGGSPGDSMQRSESLVQAVMNRARKLAVKQQKFGNLGRGDAMKALAVHLQGAGGLEHRRPLGVVVGGSDILHFRQEDEVFDVEDARGFVRPLQELPQTCEMPAFPVGKSARRPKPAKR